MMEQYQYVKVAEGLLPKLAVLTWALHQSKLQLMDAAGEEKGRWRLVVVRLEDRIWQLEREIKMQLNVLKFKTKGGVS